MCYIILGSCCFETIASVFNTTTFASVYGISSHKYRNGEEENILLPVSGARRLIFCQEINCLESKPFPEDIWSMLSEGIFAVIFCCLRQYACKQLQQMAQGLCWWFHFCEFQPLHFFRSHLRHKHLTERCNSEVII